MPLRQKAISRLATCGCVSRPDESPTTAATRSRHRGGPVTYRVGDTTFTREVFRDVSRQSHRLARHGGQARRSVSPRTMNSPHKTAQTAVARRRPARADRPGGGRRH